MDVQNSLKRKEKLTSQQEIGESSSPKIDQMIKWMQETGPILQEFAWQNNMSTKLSARYVWPSAVLT